MFYLQFSTESEIPAQVQKCFCKHMTVFSYLGTCHALVNTWLCSATCGTTNTLDEGQQSVRHCGLHSFICSSFIDSDVSCVQKVPYTAVNNQLTPWSRVLFEKITDTQLVNKFSTFYGTQRFITAFITARHLSLSWARSIQRIAPSHLLNIHFNVILISVRLWRNVY